LQLEQRLEGEAAPQLPHVFMLVSVREKMRALNFQNGVQVKVRGCDEDFTRRSNNEPSLFFVYM
jgi:hypothetical protein